MKQPKHTPHPIPVPKHPIQPIYKDPQGVLRFKDNAIVKHLMDHGGFDMNILAAQPFSNEDRVQFAQLIGYSLSGFGELSYVSDIDYAAAQAMADDPDETALNARATAAEDLLTLVRTELAEGLGHLYGKHPDDFTTP
jgi:hypothetical protein